MNVTLSPIRPAGRVEAIPSKSHAHRLLICAALSDKPTVLYCPQTNNDIDATARCLTALGAKIDYDGLRFAVTPIDRTVEYNDTAILYPGESGSTLRFMVPVVLALGRNAEFHMEGRLPTRPMSPLRESLVEHGAVFSDIGSNPLIVGGKLTGGDFAFDGGISSQFTTGLLLALPLLNEASTISLLGKVESRPYIDLTLASMASFGVIPTDEGNRFTVTPSQYISAGEMTVEGDWSNAAFMLCAGALSDDGVTVSGLNTSSTQGDKEVFNILRRFGAECSVSGGEITVKKNTLHGIEIDASDIPDLVPVLSCVAAVACGTTIIKNCGRLRLKESDRLATVNEMLENLGADIRIEGDSLVINGKEKLRGGTVQAHNDHRIVMSAAVASCACENSVTIEGAEAVNKSYPAFFADLEKISG